MTSDAPQNAMTRGAVSPKDTIQDLTIGSKVVMANASTSSALYETHVHAAQSKESLKQKQKKEEFRNKCGHGKSRDCSNDSCYSNDDCPGAIIIGADDPTGRVVEEGNINEFIPTFDDITVLKMI